MTLRLALMVILPYLVSPCALASQSACTFESSEAAHYYELEFIGSDSSIPVIVFSSTAFASGRRITLPPARYALKTFDPKTATIALAFRNPGDTALPPSFVLNGRGGATRLTIGHATLTGALTCGD